MSNELLTQYFELRERVFGAFGYVENWRAIPLDDCRKMYWRLDGEGPGSVHFAKSREELESESGNYYVDDIYTQRHLSRWVYRTDELTMVCCDPGVDGNKFLRVFDNSKECRANPAPETATQ